MSSVSSARVRKAAAHVAGAFAIVLGLALAGTAAMAQEEIVRELVRKAEAREAENGFCVTTGWPAGSPETNRAFRERAVPGATSFDTFRDGAVCAMARVLAVYQHEGRRCLRYQYWVCERGDTCGGGFTRTCKDADGNWQNVTE